MSPRPDAFLRAEARIWEKYGLEPVERRVTLATGGTVRVQEVGEGVPVVFVHGGSVAGTSWAGLVAGLDGVRCLLIDRPGCGLSDPIVGGPPRRLEAVEAFADRFLADLLDALELRRAAVAATSLGGFYAFRGAACAPERVSRLIEYSWLVGAPSETAPWMARLGSIPPLRAAMSRVPMSRRMVRSALRQFGMDRAIDSGRFDDDMVEWAYSLLRHTDTMANDIASSPRLFTLRGQNDDVLLDDEVLAELRMPVLFLWGEDDPNGGAAVAREFASRVPRAELVLVPEAQHAPWLDDPATCIERTQAFLTS